MILDDWRPHQIFYLEQGSNRLYAELIQFVAERNLCWLRPLMLYCPASINPASITDSESMALSDLSDLCDLCDLRQGSDLICPAGLLQPALDTEMLPILSRLQSLKAESAASPNADRLRQFMRQLWQAEPEAFQR